MALVCIVSIPLPGHVHPLVALGGGLRARGHDVVVYQLEPYRGAVEKAGLTFERLSDDAARLEDFLREFSTLSGLRGLVRTARAAGDYAEVVLGRLPGVLKARPPDLVLVDQSDLFAHAVLEATGLPFITVCPALPIHREPGVPPPVTSWRFKRGPFGTARNLIGYALWDALLLPLRRRINRARRSLGLRAISVSEECFSPHAQIIPLSKELDFPREKLPSQVVYTGPFVDLSASSPAPSDWRGRFPVGRRLVYAALGTLTNDDARFFRMLAEACQALDVSLILGLGGNAEAAKKLEGLPGKPLVLAFAPQKEILRECDAFVSHGGVNSVVEAGLAAVPLVIVPYTNDQPAMAARVAHGGWGRVLSRSRVTRERLRECLADVLDNPRYRHAAGLQRDALRASGGRDAAVDVVEAVLRKLRPCQEWPNREESVGARFEPVQGAEGTEP